MQTINLPKYQRILRKIGLVLLVLVMVYFVIGALAALIMIIIEATTHQMSSEIQQDQPGFQPWIIYAGMIVMMLMCFGIGFGAFLGHRAVRKFGKLKENTSKGKEVY